MKKSVQFQWCILIIYITCVNLNVATPTPKINVTNLRYPRSSSNFMELPLPSNITTTYELIDWIKAAMQSMASKIDITLASTNDSNTHQESSSSSSPSIRDTQHRKVDNLSKTKHKSSPRNTVIDVDGPWFHGGNDILSPLLNANAFLPLVIGNNAPRFPISNLNKYLNINSKDKLVGTTPASVIQMQAQRIMNNSESKVLQDPESVKISNAREVLSQGLGPFSVPFEAYVTITRESSLDDTEHQQQQQQKNPSTTPITNDSSDNFPPYSENKPANLKKELKKKNESPFRLQNSAKRQLAVLGDLLKKLGLTKKLTTKPKIQAAATTSTVATAKPNDNPREQFIPQPSFDFEDLPQRPRRNETSQRQEFDEDEDDYEEEEEGSLGSITDLLPIAIPILEDLSKPDSDIDLVSLLESVIPLVQGLLEPDEDGNGGAKELIEVIVPVIMKIVNGPNGQGSDIGAIIGPAFGLLVPFIGPVLGPIIGPLIRTISNPPTEGSSLAALLTAVAGPLSTPVQPSGMSPLSIVIAGTAAALLKELKPGAPGGSDIGAFVSAILSGVIAGTSAGLSGGSSHPQDSSSPPGYAPYAVDVRAPTVTGSANTDFADRPSPGPPLNSPFNIVRPNGPASTVNIGSTVRPPPLNHPPRPPSHEQQYARPGPASYAQQRPQTYAQPHGPVSAAATYGNGGSSYLPYGSTAVPAASVNPFSLITMTVKDILGAGLQVVSSFVNVIFGLIGASSSSKEEPKPSYGPPTGSYNYASG